MELIDRMRAVARQAVPITIKSGNIDDLRHNLVEICCGRLGVEAIKYIVEPKPFTGRKPLITEAELFPGDGVQTVDCVQGFSV